VQGFGSEVWCSQLRHNCAPSDQLRLRFVEGRPVSTVSADCLCWWSERRHAARKTTWLLQHNGQVKQGQDGVRTVVCLLPRRSRWLNAIAPMWVHRKHAVIERDRLVTAQLYP